jgi:hypothetical protein
MQLNQGNQGMQLNQQLNGSSIKIGNGLRIGSSNIAHAYNASGVLSGGNGLSIHSSGSSGFVSEGVNVVRWNGIPAQVGQLDRQLGGSLAGGLASWENENV